MTMQARRRATQRGSVVFELPLLVGLILIPFGLLVISIPTWVERQTAARDAAGEIARTIALGGDTVDVVLLSLIHI